LWTRYSALSLKARLAIGAAVFVIVLGIIAVATSAGNSKTDDDRTAATRSAESTAKTTTSTIATTTTAPRPTTTTAPVAALRAAMDAEADRACKEAQATGEPPQVRYSPSWSRTGTSSAELQFMVAACVQQAIDAQLAGAGPIDVDGVTKNPDAYTGQVFVIVVEISQFDAATGPCSFRAYWDNADHQYTFDYAGDNAYFSSGDGDSSCPILDGIDQEDVVRVWVRSTGSLSYETTLGGSTTVPSFEVLKAELIRKE
jgi:hypothetical protein